MARDEDLSLAVLQGVGPKGICLFYDETPSHGPIPPIVRMARWPKTPGGLEKYIGAESVRTIRQAKNLLFVMCTVGVLIG